MQLRRRDLLYVMPNSPGAQPNGFRSDGRAASYNSSLGRAYTAY